MAVELASGESAFIAWDGREDASILLRAWLRNAATTTSTLAIVPRLVLVRDVYNTRAAAPVMPSFLWNQSTSSSFGSTTAAPCTRKQKLRIGRSTGVLLADEYVAVRRVNGKSDTDDSDSESEWLFVNVSRGEPLREYLVRRQYVVVDDDDDDDDDEGAVQAIDAGTTGSVPESHANGKRCNTVGTKCVGQSASEVLLIAPTAFESNSETFADNSFMTKDDAPKSSTRDAVLREHMGLYNALHDVAGVSVHIFSHCEKDETPDAVFPNNWFSTSAHGRLVLYPMKTKSRQRERRHDIIAYLRSLGRYEDTVDLLAAGSEERYGCITAALEGTGSLVLDHINRIAYAALSERTDELMLNIWSREAYPDYTLVTFRASDRKGQPIYHTNVVCSVGTDFAVVCSDCISDAGDRQRVVQAMSTGRVDDTDARSCSEKTDAHTRDVIEISIEQMEALCANVLELEGRDGRYIAMSEGALEAFGNEMRRRLTARGERCLAVPFETIERVGGGGVRCAIAELF